MGLFGRVKGKKEETAVRNEIVESIGAFRRELKEAGEQEERHEISREEFVFLLSGIATCRKAPGIPVHMGYEEMYHCESEEAAAQTREHLERLFGVTDRDSLEGEFEQSYSSHDEYVQFQSFWNGEPAFDIKQLNPHGLEAFQNSKNYAAQFRPLVEHTGFYAWDCNERIGLCRKACACGILTEEEFWEITLPLARRAASWFDSWESYAVSCLCGAVYFSFRTGYTEEETKNFYELNLNLVRHLTEQGGAWSRNSWYHFPEKQWAIPGDQMKELLEDWEGADGCIATDRILVDGCPVGYLYREEPDGGWDSGWRFMAGDETQDYMDNPEKSGIYKLNTICNYDPDIIPLLKAPYGSQYARGEDGKFYEE